MRCFKHNNKFTVAPPGSLPNNFHSIGEEKHPPIIVASMMRSGTHVLIDTILNNFKLYRRCPLYIDMDQWLSRGFGIKPLMGLNNVVIKTHYPQTKLSIDTVELKKLLNKCVVLTPTRDKESIWKSATSDSFDYYQSRRDFEQDFELFHQFWEGVNVEMPLKNLLDNTRFPEIIKLIESESRCKSNSCVVFPPHKKNKKKVYFYKGLTRLIGAYSPTVNTTIGFSKK